MKVSCDFLPGEFKSFLLDTQALALAVVFGGLTAAACVLSLTSMARERSSLTKENEKLTREVTDVINQLKSITYDQAAIQELITKFKFVQQAMGATDYPHLRFYQAIENAVPISQETRLKRIHFQKLSRMDGERFSLAARARERGDVTQFEKNMLASKTSQGRLNFQDVKLLSSTVDSKDDNWTFEMQFVFQP